MVDAPIPRPEFPIVIFGDGMQGRIVKSRRLIDDEGLDVVEIRFYPSPPMVRFYNLDDRDLDSYGTVTKKYLYYNTIILGSGYDPVNNSILIFNDFMWGETNLTRRYPEIETINNLQRQVYALRGILGGLYDMLINEMINRKALISKEVELIKEVASARADKGLNDQSYASGDVDSRSSGEE